MCFVLFFLGFIIILQSKGRFLSYMFVDCFQWARKEITSVGLFTGYFDVISGLSYVTCLFDGWQALILYV